MVKLKNIKIQIIFFDDYLNHTEDYMKIICDKTNFTRDKKFNKRDSKVKWQQER